VIDFAHHAGQCFIEDCAVRKYSFAGNFTRSLIARAVSYQEIAAGNYDAPIQFATKRWGAAGPQSVPAILRSALGSVSASPLATIGAKDDEFFSAVFEASVLGRLQGLRDVLFNVRTLAMSAPSRGYWVGQSKPIPLSKPVLAGSFLPRKKIGALIVVPLEAIEHANVDAEARFEMDLREGCVGPLDEALLDPANAGSDSMPAAITNGAPTIASDDDPSIDLPSLIEAFTGDLSAAFFVTDPTTATQLALARDSAGAFLFPDIGPRGGSILGIPTLTTRHSPRTSSGQLALIDPTGIAARFESIELARSMAATLEMDTEPTGASDTPVAASTAQVSLFQNDLVAFRATLNANWERQRAAVSVLTGINYTTIIAS
jgi:hypothetical protein